jgi:Serine aminopeptidase, S33
MNLGCGCLIVCRRCGYADVGHALLDKLSRLTLHSYQPRDMNTLKNLLAAICSLTFVCSAWSQVATFYEVPTERAGVTMNILFLNPETPVTKALIVVPGTPGSEGRIMIKGVGAARFVFQYTAAYASMFKEAGIALVAMGCPTDQWERFNQCDDTYRSSKQYVEDTSKVLELLRSKHGLKEFYLFGHSSGGISSRWLSLNMPDQFKGVINSSIMNGTAGTLARSTLNFDMTSIKIPVLNIAHEDDQCRSTPYSIVKRYSKDNLVTVRGGGQSGDVCGGTNRHSFEGRQKGVSQAIIKWINTSEVQKFVDDDGQ